MKMGGRRSSAIRYAPVYVIQFSKICEPLPPTPYDENSRFRYCTSKSIHEAKSVPEVVVETRPSKVATIIQRASAAAILSF